MYILATMWYYASNKMFISYFVLGRRMVLWNDQNGCAETCSVRENVKVWLDLMAEWISVGEHTKEGISK